MNTAALPGERLALLGTPGIACCIYSPANPAPTARNQLPELSVFVVAAFVRRNRVGVDPVQASVPREKSAYNTTKLNFL